MRVLRSVQDGGGKNLMGKSSLAPVRNLWNEWEIHGLILASLALQVLLFFTGGMRRRSTSRVLSTVLWLAYLSADTVAVFVLGHLAVHGASGSEHELILFWAPFLLVHLGGQDTITALSVQDNELWTRHLLGFVSQVGVAGYVVSRSSWPDKRLLAATVLVFLAGSFKYACRTYCLFVACPANLRVYSLENLSLQLAKLKTAAAQVGDRGPTLDFFAGTSRAGALQLLDAKFDLMIGMRGGVRRQRTILALDQEVDAMEIISADAPLNEVMTILAMDDLPRMLERFQSTRCLGETYKFVAEKLVKCYELFYTKIPIRDLYRNGVRLISKKQWDGVPVIFNKKQRRRDFDFANWYHWMSILFLIATIFQYLSTPIALVLFILAEKGKGHQVHSGADVVVTYILLVGAIILDVCSASTMSILLPSRFGPFRRENRIMNVIMCLANYIRPAWSSKQWSEKLARYSMVKRYTMDDTSGMSYVWQWINKRLIALGVELLDPSLTHTPVTEDLKGSVLNSLLQFGTSKQYNIANCRGQLALQKWRHNGPGTMALYFSINGVKDFPTSVLIWHIATDICYYNTTNTYSDKSKKKQMSRELSDYIMYLVFKCGVLLTSNSRLVHDKVQEEMEEILTDQHRHEVCLGEKEVVKKVFEGKKHKQLPWMANEDQEPANTDNATTSHMKKLLNNSAEAIYSPVLPRASRVAEELMGIETEDERWDLMAAVWIEMLLYSAPRCGGAFHYEHLATGGEFITHVLLLMRSLGPFLPGPDSSAP